jgi:inner membrane protein
MATGAAIFHARPGRPPFRLSAGAVACVALAVLPDIDYLAWWLLRVQIEPRITHTLLFCAMAALLVWLPGRYRIAGLAPVGLATLLMAAGSHLLLDYSVGVHALPLLWPLVSDGFVSPVGVLPSAGKLALGNPYLWRNLLIEMGVVLPVLALLLALGRQEYQRVRSPPALLLLPLWLLCLTWSIGLRR